MRLCPHCGAQNADDRSACFACNAELASSGQQAAFGPPAGYVPLRPVDEVDEEFLSEFSWGPGCQYYLFSRALLSFLLVIIGLVAISVMLNASARFIDEAAPADIMWMGLASLAVLAGPFWVMVRAGKVARRRRWELLNWRDFESFRRSELMWRRLGMIGWLVNILAVIRSFFASS